MSAATDTIDTRFMPGVKPSYVEWGVAASTTLYEGWLAAFNTSGYIVSLADTQAYRFAGIVDKYVDNSAGANGAVKVRLRRDPFRILTSGASLLDIGMPAWGADNQTASLIKGNVPIGTILDYESATKVWVDPAPAFNDLLREKILEVYIPLTGITAQDDVLATLTMQHRGRIVGTQFRIETLETTGGKDGNLGLKIGTTAVTGGVVTLASAAVDAIGDAVNGSAITAANKFVPGNSLVVYVPNAVSAAFAEGDGRLWIRYV